MERQYQRFIPNAAQQQPYDTEKPISRELKVPAGIDSVLDDIKNAVEGTNLAIEYRQKGGQ